ncbi:DUF5641 domain-containing protein [Trichonephila clavipes]|uniref:DUF5641 domain-containing protein n=1 Tax=Trichonephila clavipes TaxID=2585209 RepID=A0A8X6UXT0_TRICX|nr:DUF5641 domain-containing protein [Trichonephila clavipes]
MPKHSRKAKKKLKTYPESYPKARSVEESLRKILGKGPLNFEEITTVLTEIEAVLNLRPLSYVYEENDEPRPLTLMHFLNFGQNQPTYPVTFAEILEKASKKSLLKRKKYQQCVTPKKTVA